MDLPLLLEVFCFGCLVVLGLAVQVVGVAVAAASAIGIDWTVIVLRFVCFFVSRLTDALLV